jgi:membrane associated rhomboid family serine protease
VILPLKDENPTSGVPVVTLVLLALNLAVFAGQLFGGAAPPGWAMSHGFVPAEFGPAADSWGGGRPWGTLITSMFLHGGVIHLAGNLLFLWIFGNNVEDALGSIRFVLFYAVSGLGAHAAHLASDPFSPIPTVGASGAISGVLAAYLLRFPKASVHSLLFLVFYVRLIRVPALVVIGLWFLQQAWQGASSLGSGVSGGGVAWFEHLGGFATGLVLFPALGGRVAWGRR